MDNQDRISSFLPKATRSGRSYGVNQVGDARSFHHSADPATSADPTAAPIAHESDGPSEYQFEHCF